MVADAAKRRMAVSSQTQAARIAAECREYHEGKIVNVVSVAGEMSSDE